MSDKVQLLADPEAPVVTVLAPTVQEEPKEAEEAEAKEIPEKAAPTETNE